MSKELLCREIVGRRVRLKRTVTTNGGWSFKKGRIMQVTDSYRGRFGLQVMYPERVPWVKHKNGGASRHHSINGVSRNSFEVLP